MNLTEYTIKTTVGTGSFGRVKLIVHNKTGKYHALKIMKKNEIIKLKQVDHILSEISILNMVEFPFCVNMYGITQDERFLYIVLEYVPGGELFTYLRTVQYLQSEPAKIYAA